MEILLWIYAIIIIVFFCMVYIFFDSEIKRLNPLQRKLKPIKPDDVIDVKIWEEIKLGGKGLASLLNLPKDYEC